MNKIAVVTAAGALLVTAASLTGCEIKNPATSNAAASNAAVARAPDEGSADKKVGAPRKILKMPVKKEGRIAKTPSGKQVQELLVDDALRKRVLARNELHDKKRADKLRRGKPPTAKGGKPAAHKPDRSLTSKDFTSLAADDAKTATKAPTAKDLKRYVKDLKGKGKLMARIETTQGDFNCELYEKQAPITVANFVGLARGLKAWMDPVSKETLSGVPLYQDVLFHRVIPNFMIQGGDPTGTGMSGPGYKIPDEFHDDLKHEGPGILSMANAGPNTGGSQFFITERSTPHLNNRHTVFGKCDNEELVKKLARVEVGAANRPVEHVKIKKIVISRSNKK